MPFFPLGLSISRGPFVGPLSSSFFFHLFFWILTWAVFFVLSPVFLKILREPSSLEPSFLEVPGEPSDLEPSLLELEVT